MEKKIGAPCVTRGYHVNALNASPFDMVQKRKKFAQRHSGEPINANKELESGEI